MANADFSRQQNHPSGGFDAGSYRAAEPAGQTVQLTPFQKKLAGFEKALPAALGRQAAAIVLSVVVMAGCFLGFGGAKLKAKYREASQWFFTAGLAADGGYTLSEELTTRLNTASNIITTGVNTLGADSTEVQTAQTALDDFAVCLTVAQGGDSPALTFPSSYSGGKMHMLYQTNEALGTAISQLYAKMQEQAADPMKMGAVQSQYSQFNSAQTIISNLSYNDAVRKYQNEVSGFPADILGRLLGIQEVELFA